MKIIQENEKANVASHIEAVKEIIGSVKPEALTSRKAQKVFIEWKEGAAQINPETDELESAAWRAALDSIVRDNDLRLLDIVKSLHKSELLMLLSAFKGGGRLPIAEGAELIALGLARHSVAHALSNRLTVASISISILSIVTYFFAEESTIGFVASIISNGSRTMDVMGGVKASAGLLFVSSFFWTVLITMNDFRYIYLTKKGWDAAEKIDFYKEHIKSRLNSDNIETEH
jgi:hypothetical protein